MEKKEKTQKRKQTRPLKQTCASTARRQPGFSPQFITADWNVFQCPTDGGRGRGVQVLEVLGILMPRCFCQMGNKSKCMLVGWAAGVVIVPAKAPSVAGNESRAASLLCFWQRRLGWQEDTRGTRSRTRGGGSVCERDR